MAGNRAYLVKHKKSGLTGDRYIPWELLYRDNLFDLRDFFFDYSFDSCLEGEGGHWAAFAGTLESNFDHFVLTDIDQFDISAV